MSASLFTSCLSNESAIWPLQPSFIMWLKLKADTSVWCICLCEHFTHICANVDALYSCCSIHDYESKTKLNKECSATTYKTFFHYWDVQALSICQLVPRHISAQCTPVTRCLKANLISQASHNILKQDILRPNKTSNNSGILSPGNQPHCVWIFVGNLQRMHWASFLKALSRISLAQ